MPSLQQQLRQRLPHWAAAGAPPSVLRTIREGAALPFARAPPRFRQRGLLLRSDAERAAWQAIKTQYVENDAIRRPLPGEDIRCISSCFLIPKKEPGKFRFIIDLRRLNKYLRALHCRYGSLKQLRGHRFSHFVSFDLRDAYHAVGIRPDHQTYLGFEVEGELFVCTALPFGLSASPAIFCSVSRVVKSALLGGFDPDAPPPPPSLPSPSLPFRPGDLCVVHYLDDFLLACRAADIALVVSRRAVAITSFLGFELNLKKCSLDPSTVIQSLGLEIDGEAHVFRVTAERAARLSQSAKRLLLAAAASARWVKAADLSGFCGLANACTLAAPIFALHLRPLYSAIYAGGAAAQRDVWRRGAVVRLPHQALQALRWFISVPRWFSQSPFWAPARAAPVLWTDASDVGWGAVFAPVGSAVHSVASGRWDVVQQQETIHVRELRAVLLGLDWFAEQLRPGDRLCLFTDNTAVLYMIRRWTTRDVHCLPLLHRLAGQLARMRLRLEVEYIASAANPADAPSRAPAG